MTGCREKLAECNEDGGKLEQGAILSKGIRLCCA